MVAKFPGVCCWISFQCRNEKETARGEPFEQVVHALLNHPASRFKLKAIGVNCTQPEFLGPLLILANRVNKGDQKVPYVVYPNSGENWDEIEKCWTGDQVLVNRGLVLCRDFPKAYLITERRLHFESC